MWLRMCVKWCSKCSIGSWHKQFPGGFQHEWAKTTIRWPRKQTHFSGQCDHRLLCVAAVALAVAAAVAVLHLQCCHLQYVWLRCRLCGTNMTFGGACVLPGSLLPVAFCHCSCCCCCCCSTDLLAIAVAVVSFLAKDKRGQTIQLLLHNLQLFVGR